ncbi:hypothetical protein A9P82_08905 [Arachidicoccus ginsenosidimutans]|uniref:cold-shock protein n=1 Tax=Arachidicoccus sp. BS20 TaxID=1850526 RepID=UPI0007F18210|nr:cold shock domain-containing protein [Arachidicoccus sp. BS20]ANI89402.1 hypothetical protein A9P82_08905 [Arachidicoccus sp. BS20]
MAITTAKKEKEKKKAKEKQEKAQKMLERRQNAKKGKSLEEMMAYVDENGNLTSSPPGVTKKINATAISINEIDKKGQNTIRKGMLTSFNDAKGYGFITDLNTQESIFVHMNSFKQIIKKNDVVVFEVERTPKGQNAVNVKKLI